MSEYDNYQNKLNETKNKLDEVSPTFCVAKWKQVTMHLQNGHTHSCHHPRTHVIPIAELKNNYKALHNTQFKKEQRKLMLEGKRPEECDYCWRVEDSTTESFSDRTYKSATPWAEPFIDDIRNKPWDDDVDPSYVEVNFSSVCNFKCSYCAPNISSQWMEEIEKYGPYPTDDRFNNLDWLKHSNMIPIPNRVENPYVDAFWKWWPTMYDSLAHFRITGGEPLLSKDTFKVLDYIIENPNPNLGFSINTNLNPPDSVLEKFIEKIKIIVEEKKVKEFKIFTSAEAQGEQCNYIRFGMNYDKWLKNIYRIFNEIPQIEFTIMSTYNILSIPSYIKFLNDVLTIKKTFGSDKHHRNPMLLDIPYLRYPSHQAIFIADQNLVDMIYKQVTHIYANLENKDWSGTANKGFYLHEADKLKRIYEMAKSAVDNPNQYVAGNRRNFVKFVNEHDKRRGTNFLETFPEFTNFYNKIKRDIL